jgi:hypothetical protein
MADNDNDNIEDCTVEFLRDHVQQGIDQLQRGDLYMEPCHLSETDIILDGNEDPPPKSDKSHKYNKLLEQIALNIVAALKMDKKKFHKKTIVKQLKTFNKEWAALIKTGSSGDGTLDATGTPKETKIKAVKTKESTETAVQEQEEEVLDEIMPEEEADESEEVPVDDDSEQIDEDLAEKKDLFEMGRDDILKDVPNSVKARWGQICFTKWSKDYLPCLSLSPFDVPPGPARNVWLDMYDKVSTCLPACVYILYVYMCSSATVRQTRKNKKKLH